MKNLLIKDLRLALHPTVIIFLVLSAMLLIPSYPYYVILFYSSLGLFFVCLSGRENHDLEYSLTLPVRKGDIVRARIAFAALIQLAQLVIAIPFAILRQALPIPANPVGMEANIAFFAIALMLCGLYNLIFFPHYYAAPDKVGKAFALSSVLFFVLIAIAETLAHVLPFFRNKLDTPDPMFLTEKLIMLAAGIVLYAAFTLLACRISVRKFEKLDI